MYKKIVLFTFVMAMVFSGCLLPTAVYAAPATNLAAATQATVQIVALDEEGKSIGVGSGSLVTSDGLVLTNYHVVKANDRRDGLLGVRVPKSARTDEYFDFLGKLLVTDEAADLAVLQIVATVKGETLPASTQFPVIPLGDSDKLAVGDEVYALGYPDISENQLVVTRGMISGIQDMEGKTWILSDVVVSNGNSGGMLIDSQGELVAIPTAVVPSKKSAATMAYLRPINDALPLIKQAMHKVKPGNTGKDADNVLFQDLFTANSKGWKLGQFSGKLVDEETRIVGGKLQKSATFKNDAITRLNVPNVSVQNFRLTVDAEIVKTSGEDPQVGITFREDEAGNYYAVDFSSTGAYMIQLWHDEAWETLQDWTTSDAIHLQPGLVNTFSVLVKDTMITVYANGEELTTVEDTTLQQSGAVGLSVSGTQNTTAIVAFDNLLITEAAQSPTPAADALFQDDFTNNTNGWGVGQFSDQYATVERGIVRGQFQGSVRFKRDALERFWVPNLVAKDFQLTVDAAIVKTTGKADADTSAVISFREDAVGNYYAVRFSNTGSYIVDLWNNNEWHTLQDWTESNAIHLEPGKVNTFSLLVSDHLFTIYANGEELTTIEDATLEQAGKVGLGVNGQAATTALVTFDNLVITNAQAHSPMTSSHHYKLIKDDTSTVTVMAPEEWSVVNSSHMALDDGKTSGVVITATTPFDDKAQFHAGMMLFVVDKLTQNPTLQELGNSLKEIPLAAKCTTTKRADYGDEQYSGIYDTGDHCTEQGGQVIALVAKTKAAPHHLVLLVVLFSDGIDMEIVKQIMTSLTVNESAVAPQHNPLLMYPG